MFGRNLADLGINALVSNGILSNEALEKLKALRPNPKIQQLLHYVADRQLESAREIAFDSEFIQSHPHFVAGGRLITAAIEADAMDFAQQAMNNGYILDSNLLLSYILQENFELAHRMIVHNFLPDKPEL